MIITTIPSSGGKKYLPAPIFQTQIVPNTGAKEGRKASLSEVFPLAL
jgi:hypothetical protein